jgi:signal transduction histidine kinase
VIDERNRLARDLHDSVSQTLFSLNLEVSALDLDLRRRSIDESGELGQRITAVSDLASQAAADMRQLIFHLVPETLRRVGLISSIEQHAEALARRSKLHIDVEASANIVCVNDAVERDVFLVVQEALHNAVKHARARTATVRLLPNTPTAGGLRLEIEDDGVGFGDAAGSNGLGLASIRERAARHGGGLSIEPRPNGGTCLVVEMTNAHH